MGSGVILTEWYEYRRGWGRASGEVIGESLLTIFINGSELATIMCSPREQDLLALGLIKNEEFIIDTNEVDHIYISKDGCCVDVWLNHAVEIPERKIITSGCGGGVTFEEPAVVLKPLEDSPSISPQALVDLFGQLHFPGSLHARARGVHAAGLSDGKKMLVVTEDVGRHNAIDKLLGACMVKGIETHKRVLLTTGRVSSEMMLKGARMGCPIVASRNSPTSMSIALAKAWNITLVGYVRKTSMRVYTHPERLGYSEPVVFPSAGD